MISGGEKVGLPAGGESGRHGHTGYRHHHTADRGTQDALC
jgi:hypothetical protein